MTTKNTNLTAKAVDEDLIYETTDYDLFKLIQGNREFILRQNLVDDLKTYGRFEYPIMVNEKMEIIDGQHRFLAAKEVGAPISFFINAGADEGVVRRVNTRNENWTISDYIHSFKEKGIKDYVELYRFMNEDNRTKCLPPTTIVALVAGSTSPSVTEVKNGTYKVGDLKQINAFFDFMNKLLPYVSTSSSGRFRDKVAKAIYRVWEHEHTDKERLFEKLSHKTPEVDNIMLSLAEQSYISKEIADLYNFHLNARSDKYLNYVMSDQRSSAFKFVD